MREEKMLVFIFIKCRINFEWFALVNRTSLQVHPYPEEEEKGLFYTFK